MADITVKVARLELDAWAKLRGQVDESRDETVRRALAAGVSKSEIHQRTGLARTTIDRIDVDAAAAERAAGPSEFSSLADD